MFYFRAVVFKRKKNMLMLSSLTYCCRTYVALLSLVLTIPSFRYKDNSVYLHELSPFSVGITTIVM